MTRQDQQVAEGGNAIQATGDVNINTGITPGQIVEIVDSLGKLVQTGTADALGVMNDRLADFRATLLEDFAKAAGKANPEAFREPDFQYVVNQAQIGHARRGDDDLKSELVKLLVQRSALDTGTRKAMILNEAIITATSLTRDEYGSLAIVFLVKDVLIGGIRASDTLKGIREYFVPFIRDLPDHNHSAEYLESMRCVSINLITGHQLWDGLYRSYSARFSTGIRAEILAALASEDGAGTQGLSGLIIHHSVPQNGRMVISAYNEKDLREKAAGKLSSQTIDKLVGLFNEALPTQDDFRTHLLSHIPELAELESKWSGTCLNQSVLTALGKALAHSALVSKTTFSTDLEIWVQ